MSSGRHQITVGTQSDYRSFSNGFAQNQIRARGSFRRSTTSSSTCCGRNEASYTTASPSATSTGFDITKYKPSDFGLTGVVNGGLANSAGTGQTHYLQKYSLMGGLPLRRDRRAATRLLRAGQVDAQQPFLADVRSACRYADLHDRPARESARGGRDLS